MVNSIDQPDIYIKQGETNISTVVTPAEHCHSPVKECHNHINDEEEVISKDKNEMSNVLEVVNSLKVRFGQVHHYQLYSLHKPGLH